MAIDDHPDPARLAGGAGMRRLRILCLHGYHGHAELLERQMRPLASELGDVAELVYVNAPSLAHGDFGWWHAEADATGARHYRGWPETRAWILALCADAGPFDGVFGFSQGAVLAGLLAASCALEADGPIARHARLQLAIMVGGFASNDPRHAALFERPGAIRLPSLHIIGRGDTIVPSTASYTLASRFRDPVVVDHPGGHVIPGSPEVRDAVRRFLDELAHRRDLYETQPIARVAAPPR